MTSSILLFSLFYYSIRPIISVTYSFLGHPSISEAETFPFIAKSNTIPLSYFFLSTFFHPKNLFPKVLP